MIYNIDYTNCKVLIRDELTGETIAQAKIIEYNKKQLSIFVDARDFIDELSTKRLILLIFTNQCIHHFGGVARKSYSPRRVEISMFQGKEHDDRSAQRYATNIEAVINNILYAEENETPQKSLKVRILNLSANGALIEAADNDLDVKDSFTLNINIAGTPTLIKCIVVRRVDTENGMFQYGCRFLTIENQ